MPGRIAGVPRRKGEKQNVLQTENCKAAKGGEATKPTLRSTSPQYSKSKPKDSGMLRLCLCGNRSFTGTAVSLVVSRAHETPSVNTIWTLTRPQSTCPKQRAAEGSSKQHDML